ncbi:MAG: esterase-like activity of phytase family protein [Nocardioides sp.]
MTPSRLALATLIASLVAGVPTGPAGALGPDPETRAQLDEPASAVPKPTRTEWTLERRATLSADYQADGPPSGAEATPANGRTGPFPGQVIPGFSGALDNGDGTFWGLPDNGFGAKDNSTDFLLRIYRVRPRWETARGGPGRIDVLGFVSMRDPDRKIDFPIINDATPERLLTGGDFDVESIVRAKDGTFWVGEEFGPFLLHLDRTGKVLDEPVPFVGGKSPQNPTLTTGETPVIPRSRGFEALAISGDGRFLYPVLEGALTGDPEVRRRWIYEFDIRSNAYTGTRWAYRTNADANVIGDAQLTQRNQLLLLERDDLDGPQAVTKKVYRVRLGRANDGGDTGGYLKKEQIVDLLYLANPGEIPAEGSGQSGSGQSGFGLGDPFSFPMQSVETVVFLKDGRLLIANDNNYPGNAARLPGTPDDTEMIVIGSRPVRGDEDGQPVIAHRGASGYRPEHTLEAYELGIRQCADFIEPDVVSTSDGVLVARHENEIGSTTDVALRPEYAARRTTKTIDGESVTGWFTEDFTLAELKTLRAIERLPKLRPDNTAYDRLFDVPTLEEVIRLAQRYRTCDGARVGIYPETKHPTYFDSIGLSMEEKLVDLLDDYGYDSPRDPAFIQSFETGNLRELSQQTRVRIVQLISCSGAPYDLIAAGDPRTYADLATRAGLAGIAEYAAGVGVCKDVMIPRTAEGTLGEPSAVIRDAHANGLTVHGWTFRAENQYLPADLRSSSDPAARGDLVTEIRTFLEAGMDGFFTDYVDLGVRASNPDQKG